MLLTLNRAVFGTPIALVGSPDMLLASRNVAGTNQITPDLKISSFRQCYWDLFHFA